MSNTKKTKLVDPKVKNVTIEEIKLNPSSITKDAKHLAVLKGLLPENNHHAISFIVADTNPATVNAIRRTVMSEILWKSLYVNLEDIDTNEEFLKLHEFCKRIAFIPVNQDVSLTAKFSIDVVNKSFDANRAIVHSSEIKQSGGAFDSKLFDSTFRVAELHPGKYLKVKNIGVKEGYAYMINDTDGANARFGPVASFNYFPLDYKHVTVLNAKGLFEQQTVLSSDIAKKIGTTDLVKLHYAKVLVVPHASNKDAMDERGKTRYNGYDHVVTGEFNYYQSTSCSPSVFYLRFRTLGNIDPKKLMKITTRNLNDRLILLRKSIEFFHDALTKGENLNSLVDPNKLVDVETIDNVLQFEVAGESDTICHLLVTNIFLLDPNVPLCNVKEPHRTERRFILNLIHATPTKLILDAIDKSISDINIIGATILTS